MSKNHHRLLVTRGPDRGRLINLSIPRVLVGRSSHCHIRLNERFVSREHFTLTLTDDGVVMQILSSRGVRVGDKLRKYRKGKQLILDGGDRICLGGETEMVLVARGADVPPLPTDAEDDAATPTGGDDLQARTEQLDEAMPEPQGGCEHTGEITVMTTGVLTRRKKKSRKLLIFMALYLSVLAAAGIVITAMRDGPGQAESELPPILTEAQLDDLLVREEPLEMNRAEADVRLTRARRRYESRHITPGDCYLCVRDYIAYKALSGQGRFPEAYDQDHYDTALLQLRGKLIPLYQRACMASRQRRFDAAIKDFETLLAMAPVQTDPLNRNLQAHMAYAKRMRAAARKTRRSSPFDK